MHRSANHTDSIFVQDNLTTIRTLQCPGELLYFNIISTFVSRRRPFRYCYFSYDFPRARILSISHSYVVLHGVWYRTPSSWISAFATPPLSGSHDSITHGKLYAVCPYAFGPGQRVSKNRYCIVPAINCDETYDFRTSVCGRRNSRAEHPWRRPKNRNPNYECSGCENFDRDFGFSVNIRGWNPNKIKKKL